MQARALFNYREKNPLDVMTQFVGDFIRNFARPEQRVLFYTEILYLFILTLPAVNHYL